MEKLYAIIDTANRQSMVEQPGQWFKAHGINILIILLGAWLIRRVTTSIIHGLLVRSMLNHSFSSNVERKKRAETLQGLISAVIRMAVWLVAAVMIIDELGINTAPLLASAGVVGVALGVGAQSFIKDFVSGIFIISENQYRVGDVVNLEASGTPIGGTVETITARTTVLRDVNGTRHHVPNGTITVASNKTIGYSKLNELIVVDPSTDVSKLEKVINKVGENLTADPEIGKLIKKTPSLAQIGGYNELGLMVYVRGDTTPGSQWVVKSELHKRLQEAFSQSKIKIAINPFIANKNPKTNSVAQ